MRIQVSAIGRLKPGPERELASHYVMRAGASGRSLGITSIAIVEHAESPAATERLRREEEAGRLLAGFSGAARLVALDEAGRPLGSAEFAPKIRSQIDRGTPPLGFFIGGPHGNPGSRGGKAGGGLSSPWR